MRRRGLRLSFARQQLLETLYSVERPLTAEEIAAGTGGRAPRSDLASVYRNLEILEVHGLVRHMHLGHGPGLYLRSDGGSEFVLCEDCGALQKIEPALLDEARAAILVAVGVHARFSHFPLTGLCEPCVAAKGRNGHRNGDGDGRDRDRA